MGIFQNEVKRYHSLSTGKYVKSYEVVDKLYEHVSFSYKGTFDQENLLFINEYIESAVEVKFGSRTDLFKIFLELAQNIGENSIETKNIDNKEVGSGMMIMSEFSDHFEIIAANPATIEDAEKVRLKTEKINRMTTAELRMFRREQLKLPAGKKGNGNVGLIKMVLIAGNKMNCSIMPGDDEFAFVVLRILIKK